MIKLKVNALKFKPLASILALSLFGINLSAQIQTLEVKHFNRVVVSPHIEVNFVQSNIEKVVIHESTVSVDKINIINQGKTLRLYLDDAKKVTKMVRDDNEYYKIRKGIYEGTVVKATVYYSVLNKLSTRGEESFVLESPLVGKRFTLRMYGESQAYINEVNLDKLVAVMMGESFLKIKTGIARRQNFRAYGESVINVSTIRNKTTRLLAMGESSYQLQVSEKLNVNSFGESVVSFTGDGKLNKRLILGETEIVRNE